ncbi:phosphatase PAP2 family protein [Enterovirga aerilata]|uniref:Phosphatase PAP2 family protein n=1 Tax=Enterovirga aerilata TaxID=2730920 RepID=A0A849I8M8_9HYPH|nr:phosphatase PAP2 family protein [Enterovirga sp. DB1703]NNM73671.1 phosphatase PAP2 family protein [Enterovirga sp. DB1703]
MMHALSAAGDTALLAPVSLALLIYLAALRRWEEARAFAVSLALGLAATLAAKLLFKACGGTISAFDISSPSGHASFSAVVYGSLAAMVAARRPAWLALTLACAAALLVAGIGVSRAALDVHSWPEVVLGWLIGAAAVTVFVALRRRSDRPALSPVPMAIGLAAAIFIVDGRHISAEHQIGRIARKLSASLDICTASHVSAALPRGDARR